MAQLGRFHQAVAAMGPVLSLDPGNARAHYSLADLLEECGRSAEAAPALGGVTAV